MMVEVDCRGGLGKRLELAGGAPVIEREGLFGVEEIDEQGQNDEDREKDEMRDDFPLSDHGRQRILIPEAF